MPEARWALPLLAALLLTCGAIAPAAAAPIGVVPRALAWVESIQADNSADVEVLGEPDASLHGDGNLWFIATFRTRQEMPTAGWLAARGLVETYRFEAIPAVSLTAASEQAIARLMRDAPALTQVQHDAAVRFLMDSATLTTNVADVWQSAWREGYTAARPALQYDLDGDGSLEVIDGSGLVGGVVDSGANALHPDLLYDALGEAINPGGANRSLPAGKVVACVNTPLDAALEVGPPQCDQDVGHGTHVAGIVAGSGWAGRNGYDLTNATDATGHRHYTGVAPGAKLAVTGIGVDTVAQGGSLLFGAQGLDWMYAHAEELGLRTVNNSWSSGDTCAGSINAGGAEVAISNALVQDKNVLVSWAAGNGGSDTASYGTGIQGQNPTLGVLFVANYDNGNKRDRDAAINPGSSDGCVKGRGTQGDALYTWPDVAAPGTDIMSTYSYTAKTNALLFGEDRVAEHPTVVVVGDAAQFGCPPEGYSGVFCGNQDANPPFYVSYTGTSMASPLVTGIALLMFQANPDLTPAEAEAILVATATPWTDNVSTYGVSGTEQWGGNTAAFEDPDSCYVNEADYASFNDSARLDFGIYECRDYKRGRGLVDAYAALQAAAMDAGLDGSAWLNVTSHASRSILVGGSTVAGTIQAKGTPPSAGYRIEVQVDRYEASATVPAGSGVLDWSVQLPSTTVNGPRVMTVRAVDAASGALLGLNVVEVLLSSGECVAMTVWATDTQTGDGWAAPQVNPAADQKQLLVGETGTGCNTLAFAFEIGPGPTPDVDFLGTDHLIDVTETGSTNHTFQVSISMRQLVGVAIVDPYVEYLRNGTLVWDTQPNTATGSGQLASAYDGNWLNFTIAKSAFGSLSRFTGVATTGQALVGGLVNALAAPAYKDDAMSNTTDYVFGQGLAVPTANAAPVLGAIGAKSVNEAVQLSVPLAATDANVGDTLTFALATNATGATLVQNAAGKWLNWTPTRTQAGTYWANVSVSDGMGGSDFENLTITVANPVPVLVAVGAQGGTVGQLLSVPITASDADGDTLALTRSTNTTGSTLEQTGPTSWLFNVTPSQAGTAWAEFLLSDGQATDSENVTLTFAEAANTAPVLTAVGSKAGTAGHWLNFTLLATDADGDTVTFGWATNATKSGQLNPATGTFNWSIPVSGAGTYWANYSVSDGRGGLDFENVTLAIAPPTNEGGSGEGNVANAPTIEVLTTAQAAYIRGQPIAVEVTGRAFDANFASDLDTITASWTDPDGVRTVLASESITVVPSNPDTGNATFNFTVHLPADARIGAYNIEVNATDDGGLFDVATVGFDVLDEVLTLGYDGGKTFLDFGTFSAGASNVRTRNNFTVMNNGATPTYLWFEMGDLRNATSGGAIPVAGNAVLNVTVAGTSVEVEYASAVKRVVLLQPGETATIGVVLTSIPSPLASGRYTTSFAVFDGET